MPLPVVTSLADTGNFFNSYIGQAIGLSALTGGTESLNFMGPMLMNLLTMGIIGLIVTSLLASIVFTCIQTYNERGTLTGLTLGNLKEGIIRNSKKAIVVSFILFGLIILYYLAMLLLVIVTPFTLILTLPLLIAAAVAVVLIYPVYIFEDVTLVEAFVKGIKLGFKSWGGLFAVLFVTGILAGLIQGVASIPWYIVFILKMVFEMGDSSAFSGSFGLTIAQYLTNIIMLFFAYIAYVLVFLVIAYHYSSASEATEALSVNEDLRNFENL